MKTKKLELTAREKKVYLKYKIQKGTFQRDELSPSQFVIAMMLSMRLHTEATNLLNRKKRSIT